MDTPPPPVDVNRLKAILGASKNLMKKVESGDFETGHIDPRALTAEGVAELQAEGVTRPSNQTMNQTNRVGYTEEDVRNSRLPDVIKKAMIERPIQQMTPNHTFTLDDVSEMSEKPMGTPRIPKAAPRRQVAESYQNNSDYITVSKDELNEMVSDIVNKKLLEFFMQNHNKRLTEDAVKKTITTLMKEGKLKRPI